MVPLSPLVLVAGCTLGGCGFDLLVAPAPREKPVLKCEVQITGKSEWTLAGMKYVVYSPDIAVVTIINNSGIDVDIGSRFGPGADLDLRVKGPSGEEIKTEPLSSLLSVQTLLGHKPYVLKPGEAYQTTVGLLGMVPDDKRIAGTYKVKAVYSFKGKEYASAEVEVKWPGNTK